MATLTDRARRYIEAMPPAIAGQNGHQATFAAAVALAYGFALSDAEAWPILSDYNARCAPPWTEPELRHKLASAGNLTRHPQARGHLAGKQATSTPRRHIVTSIPALFTMPTDEPDAPPRIHGVVRCKPPRSTVSTPIVLPERPAPESDDDTESQRIAGELVRMHQDGVIQGADDPDAAFLANLLKTFSGTYVPKARPFLTS